MTMRLFVSMFLLLLLLWLDTVVLALSSSTTSTKKSRKNFSRKSTSTTTSAAAATTTTSTAPPPPTTSTIVTTRRSWVLERFSGSVGAAILTAAATTTVPTQQLLQPALASSSSTISSSSVGENYYHSAGDDAAVFVGNNDSSSLQSSSLLQSSSSSSTTTLSLQESSSSSPSSLSSPVPPPYNVELTIQINKDTMGTVQIEVHPEWAPLAAERFRELVSIGFYDDARFFRVLPNYIAQFGIASNPTLNKEWIFCERNCRAIPDEKEETLKGNNNNNNKAISNTKGTLSFASSGKNTRQTQVFINLANNGGPPNFLDAQGFVPFAKIVPTTTTAKDGMDNVIGKLNSEYGLKESLSGGLVGSVNQGKAAYYGKEYLDTVFPGLSYIKSAKIL